MDHFGIIKVIVKLVIEDRQILLGLHDHPVGHSIRSEMDAKTFEELGLAFQRLMVGKLGIRNGSHDGRCCNAVPEKIFRTICPDDSAVIVPGSIDVDMVFINHKSLRNDREPFVSFDRKLFMAALWNCEAGKNDRFPHAW